MAEYTYKDVIIDPEDPRVEIGQEYYFALGAQACIDYANRGCRLNTLDGIASEEYRPFITDEKDYPFIIRKKEPPYRERQAEWVKEVGLKYGDKVKIHRKFDECEQGFHCGMNPEGKMDCLVGKVVEVRKIDAGAIYLYDEDRSDWWVWPYFVLEKVWDAPMPMYTEADIISDPKDPRARAALGKKVYREDDKDDLLDAANNRDVCEMSTLDAIRDGKDGYPFSTGMNWRYIIIPKEEPEEEYVPFDLSKEEDRLRLCGSWVKSKRHPDECRSICGVSSHLVFISGLTPGSNAKEFLRDFTFLDGSPCGKPANGQQMD